MRIFFINNKKIIFILAVFLLAHSKSFSLPTQIIPKISVLGRGFDQGNVSSCYSFAVANSIENYFAQKNYYGVTISPWHFYYFQKQHLGLQDLVEYQLSNAYTPLTKKILNQYGQLVPSLFLPEVGRGLDTMNDGNGDLPPIELLGKYPPNADTPLSYTTENHWMNEYFITGEPPNVGTNRLQRLIASGAILTLSLNGEYLEKEYDSTSGVLNVDSDGVGSGKYSKADHAVAVVGYDGKGLIVKNSWNSLSSYSYSRSSWESIKDTLEAWDFKRYYFGLKYQHGYYRIPYTELFHSLARKSAFIITTHKFDTQEFLNRFLRHKNNYKSVSAYYICGGKNQGMENTNRIIKMFKNDSLKSEILIEIKKMITTEMMGDYPKYRFATLPVSRIGNSDDYDYYLVYAFYLNLDNSLDEFYCPMKNNKIRTPWRATENQTNALYNGMARLANSNSIDEQADVWFQILPAMFNLRR